MKSLRCAAGLHDDGTDVFGGYSPTCLRCDRPASAGPTPTFRGSVMSVVGALFIADSLLFAPSPGNEIFVLILGGLLLLGGLAVIWRQWP